MAVKIFKRNYIISDVDLSQFADVIVIAILKHLADFNSRMVTAGTVDAYKILINDFKNHDDDVMFSGLVLEATDIKDNTAELLRVKLRSIRNMAFNSFKGTGLFEVFGFKKLSHLTDEKLIKLGYRTHRLGTLLLSEMAAEGLTEDILAALLALVKNLEQDITNKDIAEENQNLGTYYRIVKGNALNDETARLCSIGKSLYANVNPAIYNHFLMGGNANHTSTKLPDIAPTQ